MQITTTGVDLANEVFQIYGVDTHGKAVLRKQLRRNEMAKFFANLEPCLIGMEACGSAHHWARKLSAFGHTVKLMAPQFVKPYVKTNKNHRQRDCGDLGERHRVQEQPTTGGMAGLGAEAAFQRRQTGVTRHQQTR